MKHLSTACLLLLPLTLGGAVLGCAPEPPTVSSIEPESGVPGATLTITGENLSADTVVRVGGTELAELQVTPPTTISGKVPEGLKAGPADVLVKNPAGTVSRSKAFEVVPPAPADPCSTDVRRMSHIPSDGSVVKIDVYEGDEVERQQVDPRDITTVEVERRKSGAGWCSAIYLRTGAARILFDAQKDADLREQAQKIAQGLGKKLAVTADEKPSDEGAEAGTEPAEAE